MNEPVLFLGPNAPADDLSGWVAREFGNVELGDPRRTRRLQSSLETVLSHPGKSIPETMSSWSDTKAFYRLLDQELVTAEVILGAHCEGSLGRALGSGERVLLALQDTTTLNFTSRTALKDKGPIGNDKGLGIHVHSTLLVGAGSENVFGLLGSKLYVREEKKRTAGSRNREAIELKESVRWRESFQLAHHCLGRLRSQGAADLIMVNVGDREADIYDLLVEAQRHRDQGMHVLVRAQYARRLQKPREDGLEGLWDHIANLPAAGTMNVSVPKRNGLDAREAVLELRFARLELAVPRDRAKYDGAKETLNGITAIEAREVGNPDGIHWKLLTTLPVESAEDAQRCVGWYSKRWKIEVMHRVLKTGCKVEERQMQTASRLRPMIAIDLVTACYLMGLSGAARQTPEAPAKEWIDAPECAALSGFFKLRKPQDVDLTVGEAVNLIAKLGGHLGRKGDGPPGAEVLWRGIFKLRIITEAWEVLNQT